MADQTPPQPPQEPPPHDTPQASAAADQDKIRAKRLAKLGGSGSRPGTPSAAASPSSSMPSTPADTQSGPLAAPQTPSPAPSTSTQNPFAQPARAAESKPLPRIHITPKAAAPASRPTKSQEVDIDAWADQAIGSIFRITLDPNNTRDAHGRPLFFVAGVRQDLAEENKPIRLTTDMLDQAILEAASAGPPPLDYLLGCWKRASGLFRGMHNKADPKYAILREARRLCFNYCIFAATMPDMFGGEDPVYGVNPLVDYLLVDPESDRGICHDFICEAVSRFSDPENGDDVKFALVSAMEQLSIRLSKLSMNDDYKPYVLALRNFVRFPPLIAALAATDMFLPLSVQAQHIESNTLLGPFFRLSPLQAEVSLHYFSAPTTRDPNYIDSAQNALRMSLQTHQDDLFDIINCLIRCKETREKTLDWFALTVNLNHKRRALQSEAQTLASDGFMVNVTAMLDRLCEPFMDTSFSKIDRIDINYLRRSPRVDIKDETKINADQKTSDEFYSVQADGTNTFISEVFFLTVASHHYGTEAVHTKLEQWHKDVSWHRKSLRKMEEERHKYIHSPGQLLQFDDVVRRTKAKLEKAQCKIMAAEGVLLDETAQARSMQFMRYNIVWLLRLVTGGTFPQRKLELPLPEEQSMAFKCLPEYFIEDIVDNFKFITRHIPRIFTSTQSEELVMFCITFLRSSEYLKNPYLKSGLVTILYYGSDPVPGRPKGVLGDLLFAHKFATQHLLHALMNFYIECERTGASSQFYDKLNIRFQIFQVIKCIWPNSIYRENLETEARVNLEFFVHFVNLLLNDVTYVLDESFSAFKTIHEITERLKNPSNGMDGDARQEQEDKLKDAENKAKSYMRLTNETVAMLKLFTEALGDSFTKPEVVVRLAHMLDYNLDALVGTKKGELKIENEEQYGWNPKLMLAEITDVFLNLKDKPSFVEAVGTDGRSYKPENFLNAGQIMKRFALKSPEQLRDWQRLGHRVQAAKEAAELEEEDLGDIPDEYTDPLMATLMTDPVLLPTSKNVIDRSTIQAHLLSDAFDPFNRVPLKIDQVIPQDALRNEILAWKAERLSQKLAERNAASVDEGDVMDTS